ncbi:MAG: DUF6597 domain-containing transcriptional factor, partial [Planctomycetia bacterium]
MHFRFGNQLRAPLGDFVECLWYAVGDGRKGAREKVLPSGSVDLVVDLGRDGLHVMDGECDHVGLRYCGPVLFGAFSQPYIVGMPHQSPVAGVHFRPGGAALFFKPSLSEFLNRSVALEDVWGRGAARLCDQLADTAGPDSVFDVLESAL